MHFDDSHVNPLVQGHEAEQQSSKLLDEGHLVEKYLFFIKTFINFYEQVPVVAELRLQTCLLFKQEQVEEQNPVNWP